MAIGRAVDAVLKYTATVVAADLANEAGVEALTWTTIVGANDIVLESEPTMVDTSAHGVAIETMIPTTKKIKISAKINRIIGNTIHNALIAAKEAGTAIGLMISTAVDHTVAGTHVTAGRFYVSMARLGIADAKDKQTIEFEAVPAPFDTINEPAYSYAAS